MPSIRMPALLRRAATLAGALLLLPFVSACPQADLGAPCNHGSIDAPESKLVTFPALSCNDLLCIYADETPAPQTPCNTPEDCNVDGKNRFTCVNNACELRLSFVLERSMCSKRCESDSDCEDGGPTEKVLSDDSSCESGFRCVILQQLGEFCCEKLCVCNDDLNDAIVDELASDCAEGRIVCGDDDEMPMPTPEMPDE